MPNQDDRIDSPFDDEIRRDPIDDGRASHQGHDSHEDGRAEPAVEKQSSGWVPYSNTPKCLFCGYELSGLDVGSKCPECGKPIWESNIQPPVSGMSIASMVCGITALPACVFYGVPSLILGVLAIIFGEIAARQVKRGERGGSSKGFALTGRICGWIAALLSVIGWGLIIFAIAFG